MEKHASKRDCIGQRIKLQLSRNYQRVAAYLAAFLLLFLGGARFNIAGALVISLFDTVYIFLITTVFSKLLNRNGFKFQFLNIFVFCLLLFAFVHILFLMEQYVWGPLFFEAEPKRLPFVFFKDVLIVLAAFIASLIDYSTKQRQEAEKLDFEKQDMELRFLKSQINPHFVFNVLNNIYTLAYTKHDQAPEAILKLAEMLRYVTDECQSDTIQLERELKYMENFIDLIILKTGDPKAITFEYEIDDYNVRIPPMILQPIVENSFKYSDIDTNPEAKIHFKIKVKGKEFSFEAYNTKKKMLNPPNVERTGIGLANVEQRLKLYFKKGYKVAIEETDNSYYVKMELDLSKTRR
ncbi:histidine kinase [Bacteroidales bacterium OttesenSCG-928-B11]|nr:histidine kinase [Bacteroidales bacterium OttesenSCG-928-C03]MDL2311658.1 histidine kinase [Bacteroidales bacterium OttesenSCG-928-B11]